MLIVVALFIVIMGGPSPGLLCGVGILVLSFLAAAVRHQQGGPWLAGSQSREKRSASE